MVQLNYFERTKIDNPLNIKRILGDLPTSASSTKNVGVILVVFGILTFIFSRFWNLLLGLIGNAIVAGVIMGVVYGFIIFRVFALTVFEERKKKKAFMDLMENKTSDISVIWEIQDIKEYTTERGTTFAYVDYIDGTRSVFLKCIYGSVLNGTEDSEEEHVETVTKIMDDISEMGFTWDPDCKPIAVDDDRILNMYYRSMREFEDLKFVNTFTQILDTIDYLANNVSAVYSVFFKVSAVGRHRHGMFEKLENIPNQFKGHTSFDYVNFIDTTHEVDKYLANELGISLFDREELIMMKYRDQTSVGETAVIYAYDAEGSVLKQFNKELEIERKVKVHSFDLKSETKGSSLTVTGTNEDSIIATAEVKDVEIVETYEEVKITVTKKDSEYMQLLYAEDEIKLG